jgi:hypothetical protein
MPVDEVAVEFAVENYQIQHAVILITPLKTSL